MYKKYKAGLLLLIMLTTSACDLRRPVEDPITEEALRERISERIEGDKLKDLAGQTHIPRRNSVPNKATLSEEALRYVGRYKVVINCEDAYVTCKKGTVDFILNLLDDGTAHRTIIYIGGMNQNELREYSKDRWHYDISQHEIILQRENGVSIFYNINAVGDLIVNRDKTANATENNREYYAEHVLPAKDYILNKVQ